MLISELCKSVLGIEMINDGIFLSIGFVNMELYDKMLVFIKDDKYLGAIEENPTISAVITKKKFVNKIKRKDLGLITADNPERLFYKIHNYLYRETNFYNNTHKKTIIGDNCIISDRAVIADNNVVIGNNVIIEPNAVVLEGTQIGDNCIIGANTTIGTRGFQYYRDDNEAFYIEHVGGVIIENNVDILSNSCIATGFIKPTIIHEYTKIDNLVHVGHSAEIGKRTLITAGAVIGGSSHIGDKVWVGINSVMKAESVIDDNAFICMGAVVTKDVKESQKVSGNFAVDHKKQVAFIKELMNRES